MNRDFFEIIMLVTGHEVWFATTLMMNRKHFCTHTLKWSVSVKYGLILKTNTLLICHHGQGALSELVLWWKMKY